MGMFSYKSICWSFGTTSFRTKNFNRTIEEQLRLIREFWSIKENNSARLSANEEIQIKYYDYIKSKNFVTGDAPNKAKDAREKTSGLVDLGLLSSERRLTEVGKELLSICDAHIFSDNNIFQIDKDSYLYLRQLLKTSYEVSGNSVRPFIVLLKLLCDHNYLSIDEFTYLLPLCIDSNSLNFINSSISLLRSNETSVDDVLISYFMSLSNYKNAFNYFLSKSVDEEVIMDIGMNRKSRSYDKPYFNLYMLLKKVYLEQNLDFCLDLYNCTKTIKVGSFWRSYIFDTTSAKAIRDNPIAHLKNNSFSSVMNEYQLKEVFFKFVHLFKIKATLFDYKDLNTRYIKTADVVLFKDNQVFLDAIPKAYFSNCIDSLYLNCFKYSSQLENSITLENILGVEVIDKKQVLETLSANLGYKISSVEEAKRFVEDERYKRFISLIETKFNDEKLIYLLTCFETRKDDEIQKYITDNADVPTIFEYVLGIIWFKISDMKGNILDFLNLSLDANLLPKTHASGGEADIVYKYNQSQYYPEHSLLIEATLADSTNQRRMEMEPVSRHLGQFLIRTSSYDSYCVFITTYLDINVISDFRSRKLTPYYDTSDYNKSVSGMKIIPLQTSELRTIILKHYSYEKLFQVFDSAFKSSLQPHEWYTNEIINKLA